jgi:glycosyltransferase involved in cell wall biosynthesis
MGNRKSQAFMSFRCSRKRLVAVLELISREREGFVYRVQSISWAQNLPKDKSLVSQLATLMSNGLPPTSQTEIMTDLELSIVMPCLNEAETLAVCIKKALQFLANNNVSGEVIIADNGSVDGSQQIANALGARVVDVRQKGYGAALQGGIAAARGKYVAMGDADDSYDFLGLMPFVEKLRGGADLVMGNRFQGGIAPGAMPALHRYLGNPVLSFVGKLFYSAPIGDFHCGLRAFSREAILNLNLATTGMEFASEMVVKATLQNLKMAEVPTTLVPDGRSRAPHLRSWRDGWRHLKFLLTFAPKWLFFYPGSVLLGLGLGVLLWLLPGAQRVGNIEFGVHTLLFAAGAVLIALQLMSFAVVARVFGIRENYWPSGPSIKIAQKWLTIDRGCIFGALSLLGSLGLALGAVFNWAGASYGAMDPTALMRLAIPSVVLACAGLQIMFTSFLLALLQQPSAK